MKRTLFTCFILLQFFGIISIEARTLYVNKFKSILGNVVAENTLLNYAKTNNFNTLLLYDLHFIDKDYPLSSTATNGILADFILKAKKKYNIKYVGAVAENITFFTNVIDAYNNSRKNPLEKFDIYNVEFEYWNKQLVKPEAYYCTTYLAPNNCDCNVDGAFKFYTSILDGVRSLATNNSHPITTETYIAWATRPQAKIIGEKTDNIRVYSYVNHPDTAFKYSRSILKNFGQENVNIDISIIFSSEPDFMGNWLSKHTMKQAEDMFLEDWNNEIAPWKRNINLTGFDYFDYTHNLATSVVKTKESKKNIIAFPNPVKNQLYIHNTEGKIKEIELYNITNQLVIKSQKENIDCSHLTKGIYFLRVQTPTSIEGMKLIKE